MHRLKGASIAIGALSNATANSSIVLGAGLMLSATIPLLSATYSVANENSTTIGFLSAVNATNSVALGKQNNIASSQNGMFAFGNDITTTTDNSVF